MNDEKAKQLYGILFEAIEKCRALVRANPKDFGFDPDEVKGRHAVKKVSEHNGVGIVVWHNDHGVVRDELFIADDPAIAVGSLAAVATKLVNEVINSNDEELIHKFMHNLSHVLPVEVRHDDPTDTDGLPVA